MEKIYNFHIKNIRHILTQNEKIERIVKEEKIK